MLHQHSALSDPLAPDFDHAQTPMESTTTSKHAAGGSGAMNRRLRHPQRGAPDVPALQPQQRPQQTQEYQTFTIRHALASSLILPWLRVL